MINKGLKGKRSRFKVVVLMGGSSAEHEISLLSGNEIYQALLKKGYEASKIDLRKDALSNLQKTKPDVVFIALHGRPGEDGTVQGMLEVLGIPYTGSGVLASALGMNKILSKRVWQAVGINTPPFFVLTKNQDQTELEREKKALSQKIGYPLAVKPAREGSTIGLSVVKRPQEFLSALEEAFVYDQEVLVEKFILGKEVTVGILGNQDPKALPTLEIVSKKGSYDFEAKYTPGLSEHIIPARIPKVQRKAAQEMALKAHQALGCRGFSRVDLIVSEEGFPYILEINTIPGMTKISLFPDAARAAGIEFPDLVEKLIQLALEK